MPAASPSLRWLYLAVLGPLVVLALLAWWGTQSQLKAAWADARSDAEQLAPQIAADFASEIHRSFRTIKDYPDPPTPGPPSPKEEILSSDDLEALRRLRDQAGEEISASGLPLRVLAALRIAALAPQSQSRPMLLKMLIDEAPSSITGPALRKLRLEGEGLSRWVQDEVRRHNASLLPLGQFGVEAGSFGKFHDEFSILSVALVRDKGQHIDYFTSEQSLEFLESARRPLKAGIYVSANSPSIPWPENGDDSLPPLLASAKVDVDCPLFIELRVIPEVLEASIRNQQRWTFGLLAAALVTATISLFTIHRTVSRERHLAELKSQFVASVSHELRAPLGSIRLMAESLQQERVSKPAEFHTLIAREGARLSHLIENVLDFARIEEGRKQYHFEETDLSALLRDTLRLMQPLAEDRRVHLAFDIPDITATVDPNALQQALVNLVDNAIKFSPEGSPVELRSSINEEDQVVITITDRGPGIPKSEQQNIFNRFHRLGNELRRETEGTGIGLSIVKHIVEAHGGAITVASTPTNGATFTLTLPSNPPVA
ncbi:sensor histidine kinase [Haloferula sp.]|uniref:sensor histidine kinase n=1 Tax=Haloferula sp. TaxID=2497595 RepID=UPI003C7966BB